jgi:hypothetical protein
MLQTAIGLLFAHDDPRPSNHVFLCSCFQDELLRHVSRMQQRTLVSLPGKTPIDQCVDTFGISAEGRRTHLEPLQQRA